MAKHPPKLMPKPKDLTMLKQRVITALILVTVVALALMSSITWVFPALALVFMAAGAWEWGRMNGGSQSQSLWMAGQFLILAVMTWLMGLLDKPLTNLWIMAGGVWVLLSFWLLKSGAEAWQRIPPLLRRIVGVFVLWLVWLALSQARIVGINFLMSVLCLVWGADTFAYFAGRALGGKFVAQKLAPSISPGKSWEGVCGGMVGVLILAWLWVLVDTHWQTTVPSLYTRLLQQHWLMLILAVIFMVAMSVVGDLIESLIKRSAGVKDSSQLLPGHGGVLDRIDALLPTLPIAMMFAGLMP